jgi:hypothetical protein
MSILPIQLSPEQQRIYDRMYAQAMQEGRPWTYDEHMGAIMAAQTQDFQNKYPDEWRRAQEVDQDPSSEPGGFTGGPDVIKAKRQRQLEMGQNQPTQPDIYPPDWNDFPGPFTYPESAPELIPGAEEWIKPTLQGSPSKLQNNKFFSYLQNSMQKKRNNQY